MHMHTLTHQKHTHTHTHFLQQVTTETEQKNNKTVNKKDGKQIQNTVSQQ